MNQHYQYIIHLHTTPQKYDQLSPSPTADVGFETRELTISAVGGLLVRFLPPNPATGESAVAYAGPRGLRKTVAEGIDGVARGDPFDCDSPTFVDVESGLTVPLPLNIRSRAA
jgi:hypothetical protein